MEKTLVIFTLAITALAARAQNSWTNRYNAGGDGGGYATALAVDGSGNVFVTGVSDGGSSYDYLTIKYSNAGVALWTNRYNGPGNSYDSAYAIAVDANGNVFVTGGSEGSSFGNPDYLTIKYSNDGVPLWTNRYNGPGNGDDGAGGIAVDGNGNVFVTGSSVGIGSSADYAMIKYSNDGVPLWTNRYNGPGNDDDGAFHIAVDGSGNVFVTGNSVGIGSSYDYATIKYSNDGVPLWTNRYNGPGNDYDWVYAIAVDANGNVFVTGFSYSGNDYTSSDYATIKYSNDGVPLWTNRYNGPGNGDDGAIALAVDGSGNVFVTGYSTGSDGYYYGYATIKYANDGVPLWTNRYNGPKNSDDLAYAIAVDGGGNVFVTGESFGSGEFGSFVLDYSSADYATIKYSNDGVPLWTNQYNGPGNDYDSARAIAVDGNGNVFVAGFSYDSDFVNSDYVTIKYAAPPSQSAILENPQASAGGFSFDLTAEPGGQFALQVSTNLVDWDALRAVLIPASGRTNIVEALTPAPPQKFYRALRQ